MILALGPNVPLPVQRDNRHAGGQSVFVSDLAEFINLPGIYWIPLPLPKGWESFTLAG